jgi:orotidine-5'-phosphate decarboxylase
MPDAKDQLIVALDGSPDEALAWADQLQGIVSWLKVGMTLFYATGPTIIEELHGRGFKVFCDLKLHDIPHQIEQAATTLATLGVEMLTVHASGGLEMMAAAVRGANCGAQAPTVLAVTVLTSSDARTLNEIGVTATPAAQVENLCRLAHQACVGGIVCSPLEATLVRSIIGSGKALVTPGIRPAGAARGDQSRIATPACALAAGATHLVVGRPITQAPDPAAAARVILDEMKGSEHD